MDWPTLWDAIRGLDPYTAAAELGLPLEDVDGDGTHRSGRRLYRIGPDAYVLAMPAGPAGGEAAGGEAAGDGSAGDGSARGERLPLSFYWAASLGAARRAALGRPDADDGAPGQPPAELLIAPGLLTRSAVQRWIREHQPRYVAEGFAGFSPLSGSYVRVGQLVYHFRSIRWAPEETPYAIEFDPRPADELFRKLAAFHRARR